MLAFCIALPAFSRELFFRRKPYLQKISFPTKVGAILYCRSSPTARGRWHLGPATTLGRPVAQGRLPAHDGSPHAVVDNRATCRSATSGRTAARQRHSPAGSGQNGGSRARP